MFDLLLRSLKQIQPAAAAPARKPPEDLKRKLPLDSQSRGQSQGPAASARDLLHAKLAAGAPSDRLEQEADRVADQVARMADPRRLLAHELVPLAHELTHVIQQRGGLGGAAPTGTSPAGAAPLSQERWAQNPTLNVIRAERPGDNRVVVGRGQQGEAVKLIQQALQAWGRDHGERNLLPQFGADAAFGGETDRAIRRFQAEEGLTQDGIVGPITLSRLDAFVALDAIRSPHPSP